MEDNLTENILKELAYFDILAYPLSLMDLWRRLEQSATMSEVMVVLDNLILTGKVGAKDGFYFLAGQEKLAPTRIARYALSKEKLRKATRAAKVMALFPFIRGVAVYSSLSYLNARPEGDLDFFFVTKNDRLWSARFFINFVLKIFRLRPDGIRNQDKICASFWVDESAMSLEPILKGEDDSHYLYSHIQFIFLAGEHGIREKFFAANSHLAAKFPQWQPYVFGGFKIINSRIQRFLEKIISLVSEKGFRDWEKKIMPEKFRALNGIDGRVIIQNNLLKMHFSDKRDMANEQLAMKLKSLNENQTAENN